MSAFGWGLLASSSLLLGGVLALTLPITKRALGLIMAFGAGVLISAVAYDLVQEAQSKAAGSGRVAYGLFAGAITFFLGDAYVDRAGGGDRKRSHGTGGGNSGGSGGGGGGNFALPVVLGIVLDGIPESIVIGVSLLDGASVSVAIVAAVFLSNVPESLSAAVGLRAAGRSARWIMSLWLLVAATAGIAALAGYALLDGAGGNTIGIIQAFAAGAILTMLTDTMIPEAYDDGGPEIGVITVFGFALAYLLSQAG